MIGNAKQMTRTGVGKILQRELQWSASGTWIRRNISWLLRCQCDARCGRSPGERSDQISSHDPWPCILYRKKTIIIYVTTKNIDGRSCVPFSHAGTPHNTENLLAFRALSHSAFLK